MSKSLRDEIASLVAETVQKDGVDPDAETYGEEPRIDSDYDEEFAILYS